MNLPHRFPFRWIDRPRGGRARLAWTAAAYWHRENPLAPVGWVAEAMAQAAALLLGDPEAPSRRLALAGLEGVECLRAPVAGEVLEIEPQKRLVLSWRCEFLPELLAEGYSRMTYELEQHGDSMKLTVIHEMDIPDSKFIESVSSGWPSILSSLKSLLETGESLEFTRRWPKGM